MIIDVTGAELIPGKGGQDCPGGNKYYLVGIEKSVNNEMHPKS